jgi:hypothetical protein
VISATGYDDAHTVAYQMEAGVGIPIGASVRCEIVRNTGSAIRRWGATEYRRLPVARRVPAGEQLLGLVEVLIDDAEGRGRR